VIETKYQGGLLLSEPGFTSHSNVTCQPRVKK